MKRFYQQAQAQAVEGGFGVTLDGRALKTSAKRPLVVPSLALAAALAEEWQSQGEQIKPEQMPLMQMVSTVLDRLAFDRQPLILYLAGFGQTDLLCHRAPHPSDLVARQAELWQPWLDWAAQRHQIELRVTDGVIAVLQPTTSLQRLGTLLSGLDVWTLVALQTLVPATGSILLGLAVVDGALDADAAFELSQLDETFQAQLWGLDHEAEKRQQGLRQEIAAAARLLDLLRAA